MTTGFCIVGLTFLLAALGVAMFGNLLLGGLFAACGIALLSIGAPKV